MWRVTWKGLVANKLRFLLTAIAVTIGVAFMAGTMVLTDTVERTFDDLFADVNEGVDAVVRSQSDVELFGEAQRAPVPASLVGAVERVPGVDAVLGNVQTYAQVVGTDGDPVGGTGAPTYGLSWPDVDELNPMVLREGREPRADDEIVIDRGASKRGDIAVGDRITVLSRVEPREYEVVGIATFGTADSPAGATITLFTAGEVQRIANYDGQYDDILVVAEEGVGQEELKRRLASAVSGAQPRVEVLTGDELVAEQQDQISENLSFFGTALLVFAIVALFVGSFIIYNSFSIIVAQRSREMALLRAIGASTRQVTGSVLLESVVLAVLASTAGLFGGIALASGLKALFGIAGIDIPAGGAVVSGETVFWALFVGILVTVVSAALPARRAARVPPIAAMRAVAIERPVLRGRRALVGGVLLLLGVALAGFGLFGEADNGVLLVGIGAGVVFISVFVLGPLFARPVSRFLGAPLPRLRGVTGTLARENAMRNPKRTAATASALTIGVALVGFITIFGASTRASVSDALDEQVTTDFIVTSGAGFGPGLTPLLAERVAELPEVGIVTPVRFGGAIIDGKQEFVTGAEPAAANELFDFGLRAGDLTSLGTDGVAISRRTADDKGWALGDVIPAVFGETGPTRLTIRAIYEHYEVADDYLLSLEGFEAHIPNSLDFQVFANLAEGVDFDEGRQAISAVTDEFPIAELQDQQEYKDTYLSQINQIIIMIYVLLAIAVLIALFGIANTLALSIYERTRELGLLRAVGMTRRQVRAAVRWESVIISLLGTAIGLVVGLLFGWAIVTALRDEGFRTFAVAPVHLAVVVVVAVLAGVAAAVFPARRAAKLDILRAIATE